MKRPMHILFPRFRSCCSLALAVLLLPAGSFCSEAAHVTLYAVGDVMLGRYIAKVMSRQGPDYPFTRIYPTLQKADILFGNLESMVNSRGLPVRYPDKPYNFHADKGSVAAIKRTGFDVLSLGNNHAMDYGPEALRETRKLLHEQDIGTIGAGEDINDARQPAFVVRKGVRFGFLGYSIAHANSVYARKARPGVAPFRMADIIADIQALRGRVDVLVVSLHWGVEYETMPTVEQRRDAHLIIDAGADVIVGHHPHVMQGVEIYQGKVIAYSLGNFVFDQKGKGTDRSFMLACRFKGKELVSVNVIPLDRFKAYYPRVAQGTIAEDLIGEMKRISLPLNPGAGAFPAAWTGEGEQIE